MRGGSARGGLADAPDGRRRPSTAVRTYYGSRRAEDLVPLRWHVGYGACWLARSVDPVVQPRIPDERLHRYELRDFLRGEMRAGPGAEVGRADCIFARRGPVYDLRWRISGYRLKSEAVQVEYDYLPVGENKVLLFLLTNVGHKNPNWSFEVYSCQGALEQAIRRVEPGAGERERRWRWASRRGSVCWARGTTISS